MEILDAQLHCWLLDRPGRPWQPDYRRATRDRALNILLQTGVPMPPETLLCEMAAAGVDGAALTPQGVYGNDNSFELETAANYPRKFAVVGWIDHLDPDVELMLAQDVDRGMRGIRLLRLDAEKIARGEYDRVLAWCEEHGLAVALTIPHPVPPELLMLLRRYADIEFLVDHLGIGLAPPAYGLAPDDPWTRLPGVLELARLPNVNIKLTGAAALSHELFPFRDLWDGIRRLVEAYGPQRLAWGSDITRTGALHTYAESVHYLREIDDLTAPDLELMYGRSLRRILRWEPEAYLAGLHIAVTGST